MTSTRNDVHNEAERGLMLRILVEWNLAAIPFHELRVQMMRRRGAAVSDEQLRFHLHYLAARGYVETKQLRAGRSEIELCTARATPRAVDLVEGRIADDGVAL